MKKEVDISTDMECQCCGVQTLVGTMLSYRHKRALRWTRIKRSSSHDEQVYLCYECFQLGSMKV